MAGHLEEMIEIIGETPPAAFPLLEEDGGAWKQKSIPENITIPCYKPDIEQIIKVVVIPEIIFTKISNTPEVGLNLENDRSTGKKLVVEGELYQQVVYVADVTQQSVHEVEFIVPFSTYIVLNSEVEVTDKLIVKPFIEDIFVQQLGTKNIFKNITLFLLAQEQS